MKRDIKNIKRDLEDKRNNDIICKKAKLMDIFLNDPDIQEVLGKKELRPLNKYVDPSNPTENELETRKEILEYNEKINHEQIIPYLKLNGLQYEVLNFLMFDINDSDVSYYNKSIKTQTIIVMCVVHEDEMETQYGVTRTDLLSYLVRDLLCWTNALGMQLKLTNDFTDIIDVKYYCRTMKFVVQAPNTVRSHMGMNNKYDNFAW